MRALARRSPAFRAPGDGRFARDLVIALARSGPAFRPEGAPDASRRPAHAGSGPITEYAGAPPEPAPVEDDPVVDRGLVLLAEDDVTARTTIVAGLQDAGYVVQRVGTALDALRAVTENPVDLVVLGRLSDLSGVDALRLLRGLSDVPVVVATPRVDEATITRLFQAGADDYVTEPYSREHLTSRLTAAGRSLGRAPRSERPIEVGELVVDPGRREARLAGTPLTLTRREFDLLAYLAASTGRVVSIAELRREVWRRPELDLDQTIDVHLNWLRRKLGESAAAPRYLRTVPGRGVELVDPTDVEHRPE